MKKYFSYLSKGIFSERTSKAPGLVCDLESIMGICACVGVTVCVKIYVGFPRMEFLSWGRGNCERLCRVLQPE